MSRPVGVMKNDGAAAQAWGGTVYAAIPKSVFALIAFHLANLASGECDNPGAAEKRFLEEWDALIPHGLSEPAKKLRSALTSASVAEAI